MSAARKRAATKATKTPAAKKAAAKKQPAARKAPAPAAKAPMIARAPGERRYWLMKSEPEVFSFDDLLRAPGRTTGWEGVRNYQARNYMRDDMRVGDGVLFYHSNAEPPAVAGLAEVARTGVADPTAFDAASEYHDPASAPDAPRWIMVEIRAVAALDRPVTLPALRATPALAGMALLQKGSRLSVQPVTAAEWAIVAELGRRTGGPA